MSGRLTLQHLLDQAGQPADNVGIDVTMSIAYRPLQGWFLELEPEDDDPDEELRHEIVAAEIELKQVRDNVEAIISDLWSYTATADGAKALADRLNGAIA